MQIRYVFAVILFSFCTCGNSQIATGVYQNGSYDATAFDTVNLGNLNVHFSVPIFSKPGRGGADFSFNLLYDGSIWSTVGAGGSNVWSPAPGFGWTGDQKPLPIAGELYFNQSGAQCGYYDSSYDETYSYYTYNTDYVYYDRAGVAHNFPGYIGGCPDGGDPGNTPMSSSLGASVDGITVNSDNTVSLPDGTKVTPGVNFYSGATTIALIDINGNQITWNNGVYTDTTGSNVLTAADGVFTYPTVGGSATTQITYQPYTVQTNFGCPGIGDYGPLSKSLIDRITFADGSYYAFSYEPTPGFAGSVTARISSIRLPTGGTINYSYSGSLSGVCANGMNSNGVSGKLTRTADGGQTTYDATISSNFTRVVSPANAVTDIVFGQTSTNGFYETDRKTYAGAAQGTPLLHQVTCYGHGDCSPSLPITFISTASTYDGIATNGTDTTFDTDGNVTEVDSYAFSSNGTKGPLLQTSLTSYAKFGSSDQTVTRIVDTSLKDATGQQVSHTHFGYDEQSLAPTYGLPQHNGFTSGARGTPSSMRQSTGASQDITATYTYDDAGSIKSSTGMTGTTTYGYDSTDTFVTSTTLPTPSSGVQLSTSATFDLASGVTTSQSGMNSGQTIQITQHDSLLRPLAVSQPDGGQTSYVYYGANDSGVLQTMGNGQTTQARVLLDDYGRKSRVAVFNGQGSNQWYQQDFCYDAAGLLQFQSSSYQGVGYGTPKQCSGSGTSYVYDALGRVTSTTSPDGTATTQYLGRAIKTTDVNNIQKITQMDVLGRVSSVCEISSGGGMINSGAPGDCQMDIAGTGFLTSYTYDLANHKTTVQQGGQPRTFQTDAAGRSIDTTEPERGETSYSYAYNSTGLLVTRTRPRANQTDPNQKTHTTTQYDSLGRIVGVGYDDGLTPSKTYIYDQDHAFGDPNNLGLGFSKGLLTRELVSAGNGTGEVFGYDAMGRVTLMETCRPSTCGNGADLVTYTYDQAGNQTGISTPIGTLTYGRSAAGEVTSITSSYQNGNNPGTLISNVVNGPNGPISYSLGNGLNSYRAYGVSGRPSLNWVCQGAASFNCNTQIFGDGGYWSGGRITQSDDTVMGVHGNYGYDEFNRLKTVSYSNGQTFNNVYDRWGNRWQQNAPQGGPAPNLTFNTSNNQISGLPYDAAGNLMNDGNGNGYTYDAEGNVIAMSGNTTAQYMYDAFNHRVRAQVGGYVTEYDYDYAGRRILTYLPGQGIAEQQHYWDNRQFAYWAGDGSTYFEHQDWLGTERMRTNHSGAIASTYSSLPFGDGGPAVPSGYGSDQETLHFAGLDKDSASTDHAQFRQYSNTQGRWMSPDPYDGSYDTNNPQSLNRYSYVINNPEAMNDPSGLDYGYDCGPYCAGVVASVNGADYWLDPYPIPFNGYVNFPFYKVQITPQPPPAPSSGAKRIACAAKYGQAHSIGAAFGGGTVANFLGGNSVSSLLNLGLAISGSQPLSGPPNLTGIGMGLPVNDVLRLTGGKTNPLYGSAAGTFRSAGIKAAVNSFLGTGDGIVSLSGEASVAAFGGVATTAATAAEAASVVGIAKFGYDALAVLYGGIVACSQ